MILLDTITMTPLVWSILALAIVQLVTFGKFIISLYNKITLLERKLEDNTARDSESTKRLEKFDAALDDQLKDRDHTRERFRNEVYKKITRVEEKFEAKDKEANKRINDIAQGLVIVETKIDTIKK